MSYVKNPHTAIYSGPTGSGKTELVLNIIENEYKNHFENIVILCPTLRWNETYKERKFLWSDPNVYLIESKDKLFEWLAKLSRIFAGEDTLFIVDDIISDESIDKRRQPLLELAISGRHSKHSLWLLTQSYTAIPENLRRQKKMLFVFYPNEKSDLKIIDDETNLIPDGELGIIKEQLKASKYACLNVRLEYPREYKVLNGPV